MFFRIVNLKSSSPKSAMHYASWKKCLYYNIKLLRSLFLCFSFSMKKGQQNGIICRVIFDSIKIWDSDAGRSNTHSKKKKRRQSRKWLGGIEFIKMFKENISSFCAACGHYYGYVRKTIVMFWAKFTFEIKWKK